MHHRLDNLREIVSDFRPNFLIAFLYVLMYFSIYFVYNFLSQLFVEIKILNLISKNSYSLFGALTEVIEDHVSLKDSGEDSLYSKLLQTSAFTTFCTYPSKTPGL